MVGRDITQAVEKVVMSAEVEWVPDADGTEHGMVHFHAPDLDALHRLIISPDRLNQAITACREEMLRQIDEARDDEHATEHARRAIAALKLHDKLADDTGHRYILNPDGTIAPAD